MQIKEVYDEVGSDSGVSQADDWGLCQSPRADTSF